jgi:hypothetical protein
MDGAGGRFCYDVALQHHRFSRGIRNAQSESDDRPLACHLARRHDRPRSPHEGRGRRVRPADTARASELRDVGRTGQWHERRRAVPRRESRPPGGQRSGDSRKRGGVTNLFSAGLARLVRVRRRLRAALGAVLGHDSRARQQLDRARGGRETAGPRLQVRSAVGRSPVRAARQPCAGQNHSPEGCRGRRQDASLHHHRPARRAWSGHRRLQGRLRSRCRALGRPPGLLRDFLSGTRARPDARRRHRCRSGIRAHRRRAAPGKCEARARRQLPGRLGRDDARRRAAGHRRRARHQRRADVVLGRQRRRQSDALRRRPARRRLAVVVRE